MGHQPRGQEAPALLRGVHARHRDQPAAVAHSSLCRAAGRPRAHGGAGRPEQCGSQAGARPGGCRIRAGHERLAVRTRPSNGDIDQMQAASDAWNTRLVAHHDLSGHGDGMQVLKVGPLLYVSHLGRSPMALSILDVSDPEKPRLLRQLPHEPNTHRHKVQIAGRILIQNCEKPDDPPAGEDPPPMTGLAVFDLTDPTDPQRIGFHPVGGRGVHRIWYSEPPYAHIAAVVPGARVRGYQIVDLSEPAAPRLAGSWWIPGTRAGDAAPW